MDWEGAYVVAAAATCSLSAAWFVWWAGRVNRLLEEHLQGDADRLGAVEDQARKLWRSMSELASDHECRLCQLEHPYGPPSKWKRPKEGQIDLTGARPCEPPSNCTTTGRDGPASTS